MAGAAARVLAQVLDDASIDRVALTGQLRQLGEPHLKAAARSQPGDASSGGRRHHFIIAARCGKSGHGDCHAGGNPRNLTG